MRIRRLDLTRYGKFTDHQLDFGPAQAGQPDLHILYGPNEAGKSTIFAAWLDLLFGIPDRSPMGFAHQAALQIGATLDLPAGPQQLIRVRSRGLSLRDASGAPLPEAAMALARGDLSRDSYRAMFSLDDQTLVQGGEGILASEGELGQLLFAAGAGVADLGPQLAAMRDEADKTHRPAIRSGPLYDLKKRLEEVDAARRAIDIGAADFAKLAAALQTAQADWSRASTDRDAVVADLARVNRQLAALPFALRRAQDRAALAPLAALPALPEGWATEVATRIQAQTALQDRAAQTAEVISRVTARLDGLAEDPQIIALSQAMALTEGLVAEHDAGFADLPNRQAEAADLTKAMAALLARLDQSKAAVTAVILPGIVTARLRILIASHSGVAAQLTVARRELQTANALLAQTRGAIAQPGLQPEALGILARLMAGLRARDLLADQRRALQDRDRAVAALAPLLAALQPYRGGAPGLVAMTRPDPRQVDDWIRAAEALARALAGAEATLTQRAAALRPDSPIDAADPFAQSAQSRALREHLWAAHRGRLTAQSADAFEAALRADDQLADLRSLAGAARIEAVRLAGAQTQAQADLDRATADRDAVLSQSAAHAAVVARAVATLSPDLPGAMGPAALRDWLAARALAIAAELARQAADLALSRAEAEVAGATMLLASALGTVANDPLALLLAQAEQQLATAAERQAGIRAATEAEQAAQQRQTALAAAEAEMASWQADLRAACAGSWLQDEPLSDTRQLAETVDSLETLTQTHHNWLGLQDRIAKISANIMAFEAAVAAHALALGLPPSPARPLWSRLQTRLRLAESTAQSRATMAQDLAEARQKAADLAGQTNDHAVRLAQMASHFAVTGPAALAQVITDAQTRDRLTRAVADAEADIALALGHRPDPLDALEPADRTILTAQRDALTAQLQVLTEVVSAAFVTVSEARRRIAAVGGDDAVARLDESRRTILLELEDLAQTHLRRRLGLMAMDVALKRWRDAHRGAMMARASQAFATITRGDYTGFATQTDKDRETLVALPRAGGSLLAAEMSKGTRAQLYLALRIAGYDVLAAHRPPVPFIADDILETFDDDRSAETFTLLGQMAGQGQVIYLTHHAHLCDIAARVCPGVRVQRI